MNTQTRRQGWRAARPGGDGNGDGMVLSSGRHLLSGEHASFSPLPFSFKFRVRVSFSSPFPVVDAPCRRGRLSGRALAPTPTLTTCSSPAPAWAWAWAASASAAACPCPAPAAAWPGHGRGSWTPEKRRRRRWRALLDAVWNGDAAVVVVCMWSQVKLISDEEYVRCGGTVTCKK